MELLRRIWSSVTWEGDSSPNGYFYTTYVPVSYILEYPKPTQSQMSSHSLLGLLTHMAIEIAIRNVLAHFRLKEMKNEIKMFRCIFYDSDCISSAVDR